jgi:hypothetical protein
MVFVALASLQCSCAAKTKTTQTNQSEDSKNLFNSQSMYMIKELYNKVEIALWERIILLYHIKCEREITTIALML